MVSRPQVLRAPPEGPRNTEQMNLLEVVGRRTMLMLALSVAPLLVLPAVTHEERGRVVVTETETTILDNIEFAPGTTVLQPSSMPIIQAIADTLNGNPSIQLVEVQSHTRGTGDAAANLALSDQRAAIIVIHLVALGVAPERLAAQGYGDSQPIDPASPAKNERMSFVILQRASDELTR